MTAGSAGIKDAEQILIRPDLRRETLQLDPNQFPLVGKELQAVLVFLLDPNPHQTSQV